MASAFGLITEPQLGLFFSANGFVARFEFHQKKGATRVPEQVDVRKV
jgi:hypothetical protein